MLELMVHTTLARGLILLPIVMDILLLLMPMDTLDMPDMLDTLMPPMVLMVPTLTWDKKKLLISNLHQEKSIYFRPSIKTKMVMNFNFKILLTASDYLSSATLWSL